MRFAIDPIGDVKRIGAAVAAAIPEIKGPEAACRLAAAGIDQDRAEQCPANRIERVDLAVYIAEVADQQVIAELAKIGWARAMPHGAASWLPLMST